MTTKLSNTTPAKQFHLRPVIKIPPAQVTVQPNGDLNGLTQEIAKLGMYMQKMLEMHERTLQLQADLIRVIADRKEPAINVQVPKQERGSKEYYVELDKEDDGEVVGMRVVKS